MYILKLLHRLIFVVFFLGLLPVLFINGLYWLFFLPICFIRWVFFLRDDDFFFDYLFFPFDKYNKFLSFIERFNY